MKEGILGLVSSGNYITVHKGLIKLFGTDAAILIGHFASLQNLHKDWFYNTATQIEEETGIKIFSIRKAVKTLKEASILQVDKRGIPAKLYYLLDEGKLIEIFFTQEFRKLKTVSKKTKNCSLENSKHINNKVIKINNNNKKSKPKKDLEKPKLKRTKKKPLPDFYLQYSFFTKEFSEIWFKEFLPMKQRKKASTSERALKSQLKKIAQYSSNNYKTALEILTNSVDAGWSDVYPLKTNNKQNNNQTNNWGTHAHSSYRMDYSVLETKDQDGNIINPGVPYDER